MIRDLLFMALGCSINSAVLLILLGIDPVTIAYRRFIKGEKFE